jgi:hypothetical protein
MFAGTHRVVYYRGIWGPHFDSQLLKNGCVRAVSKRGAMIVCGTRGGEDVATCCKGVALKSASDAKAQESVSVD